jgi:hypothetical protein
MVLVLIHFTKTIFRFAEPMTLFTRPDFPWIRDILNGFNKKITNKMCFAN